MLKRQSMWYSWGGGGGERKKIWPWKSRKILFWLWKVWKKSLWIGLLNMAIPGQDIVLTFNLGREIHPLDPQPHRHSMLVPTVCAPRVTRCSLGKYWSRGFAAISVWPRACETSRQPILGYTCYLWLIVVWGSEIWWRACTVPTPRVLLPDLGKVASQSSAL